MLCLYNETDIVKNINLNKIILFDTFTSSEFFI